MQAVTSSVSGQSGPARQPLREHVFIIVSSSSGRTNHFTGPITLTRSKSMGAAAVTPVSPGLPSPSALPAHTPMTYSGVVPTAQASRKPKLVPVFQARLGDDEKYCHPSSPSGLLTLRSASLSLIHI